MNTPSSPSFGKLWGWPIALGVLSTTGLVSALVSDSWGDAWSWFALGTPVATMTWFCARPRPSSPNAARRARGG